MKDNRTEGEIQKAICEYLQAKGYFFWRQNNHSTYDRTRGRFRRPGKHFMYGLPDIFVVYRGKIIGIEVKRRLGKLSDYQEKFCTDFRLHGGVYLVARCIQDVEDAGL